MAICSRCKEERAHGELYTRPDRARPSSVCRDCMRASNRAAMRRFNAARPGEACERQAAMRADPVRRARTLALSRARYAARPHVRVLAKMARDRYRKSRSIATPAWVDLNAIRAVYERATALGLEVDHIIPLRAKSVSGLHVPWNLQMLPASENRSKSNHFHAELAA